MSPKSTIYNQFFLTVKEAAFFTTQEKKEFFVYYVGLVA